MQPKKGEKEESSYCWSWGECINHCRHCSLRLIWRISGSS